MGFIVLGIQGKHFESSQIGSTATLTGFGPLYTNIRALEPAGWKPVAFIPLEERHQELTRRNVGGEIFVGDDSVGLPEDIDQAELIPDMLVMGIEALQTEIVRAFPAD